MKLHLPRFLRDFAMAFRSVVCASVVSTSLFVLSSRAAEISLSPSTTTIWQHGSGAEYTGLSGDWYVASNLQWYIQGEGQYDISRYTDDNTFSLFCGIKLDGADLSIIEAEVSTEVSSGNTAQGIRANYEASISNAGTLQVHAEAVSSAAALYFQTGSELKNEVGGTLLLSASSDENGMGVFLYNSSIINSGMMECTGSSQGIAMDSYTSSYTSASSLSNMEGATLSIKSAGTGIDVEGGSEVRNDGYLTIAPESDSLGSGIWLRESSLLLNGATGVLEVQQGTPSVSAPIDGGTGICLNASQLQNDGLIRLSGGATGIAMTAASALVNGATGELIASATQTEATDCVAVSAKESSFINKGSVRLRCESAGSADGLLLQQGASWSNEADSALEVFSVSSGDEYPYESVGIQLESDATLTNKGTLSTHAESSRTARGMFVSAEASLTNTGGGTLTATGLGLESSYTTVYGIESRGVLLNESGSVLIARAVANESANGGAGAIYLYSSLHNKGGAEVRAQAEARQSARGMELASATLSNEQDSLISIVSTSSQGSAQGVESSSGVLNNSGTIRVETTGNSAVMGIRMYSASQLNNTAGGQLNIVASATGEEVCGVSMSGSSCLLNEADANVTINVQSQVSETVYALHLTGSETQLKNSGVLELTAEGAGNVYGLYASSYSVIRNTRTGTLTSSNSSLNGGTIHDVYLGGYTQFFNEGTLKTTSHQMQSNSDFYLLRGTVTGAYHDEGTQKFNGIGAASGSRLHLGGVLLDDGTVAGLASGSTITATSSLSFSEVELDLADHVTLKMGGDFSVADNVVTHWNGNGLTVDNGGILHSVSWGNEFSGAWNGAFSIQQNESGEGLLLTQMSVDKETFLFSGKVTVGGGGLNATEQLVIGGVDSQTEVRSDTESLVLHGEQGGLISHADIAAGNLQMTAGEGSVMVVDSSILTLGSGTSLLRHVSLEGASHLSSAGNGELVLDLVSFVLGELNSTLSPMAASLALEEGESANILELDSSLLGNVSVSGNLTLDLTWWADVMKSAAYDGIAISFAEALFAEELMVTGLLGEELGVVSGTASGNTVFFNLATETVPEPGTATLSLLALSCLVTRRRRRAC